MFNIVVSNQFKKDIKLAQKRGLDLSLLSDVVEKLANGMELSTKNKDHSLSGNYVGYRECHIQPNWLLVYKVEERNLLLFLFRTGTHSDLF